MPTLRTKGMNTIENLEKWIDFLKKHGYSDREATDKALELELKRMEHDERMLEGEHENFSVILLFCYF